MPWADAIHPYAVFGMINGHLFEQQYHPSVGRIVGLSLLRDHQPINGSRIDHTPTAGLAHRRNGVLAAEEHTP